MMSSHIVLIMANLALIVWGGIAGTYGSPQDYSLDILCNYRLRSKMIDGEHRVYTLTRDGVKHVTPLTDNDSTGVISGATRISFRDSEVATREAAI